MSENQKKPCFAKSCDIGDIDQELKESPIKIGKTNVAKSCDERCDDGDIGSKKIDTDRVHSWMAERSNYYVATISNRLSDGIIGSAWVLLMSQTTGQMLIKQVGEMIADNYMMLQMGILDDMVVINISSNVKEIIKIRKQIERCRQ